MQITNFRSRFASRALLFISGGAFASPALADHVGPGSVEGGGGMTVFSPGTLDAGHGALGFRILYSRPQQRSDEELEALAGQHIHAHNTDYNLNAAIGVAYGVTHHLTVSAELPYVRRERLREGEHSHVGGQAVNEVAQLGTVSGVGDLNLLAKYRLTDGEVAGFALVAGLKLPTGSTHRTSLEGERLETEHQPGTGSWDPIVGATAGAKVGAVHLNASALYQFSGRGAQDTRLGDRLQGGIALSHRFGPAPHAHDDAHHNHHHGDELDDDHEDRAHSSWDAFVELGGEWEGRQKVGGEIEQESGGSWVYAAPGVRFNAASGWSAGASLAHSSGGGARGRDASRSPRGRGRRSSPAADRRRGR
jgi:hypothetical protein